MNLCRLNTTAGYILDLIKLVGTEADDYLNNPGTRKTVPIVQYVTNEVSEQCNIPRELFLNIHTMYFF